MSETTMSVNCFVDLRWGQEDPEPYLVPVPRIPCIGEVFVGPDRMHPVVVTEVRYLYESGFYFRPTRIVVETRPK